MATKTIANDLSITSHATQQDAQLLVTINNGPQAQKAAIGGELLWEYDSAPTWKQFAKDHPVGSDGRRAVVALMDQFEMIGTFVKQGLLDRGLVNDLCWAKGAWDKCEHLAMHYREHDGNTEIYANFERLADGQR